MSYLRWGCLLALCAVVGCGDSSGGGGDGGTDDGGGGDDGGGTMDGGGSDGWTPTEDGGPIVRRDGGITITEDGGTTWTCYQTVCDGHLLECGDCMDNDGDGLVDSRDPECLGPCDNTEGPALTAGVGGETGGPCKADCYFDFGNGSGNDDCYWDHRCDPKSVPPDYPPEGEECPYDESNVGSTSGGIRCPETQSDTCLDVCPPLTPNGCDCFGCCTFDELEGRPDSEGGEWVWIGSVVEGTNEGSCSFDEVEDTSKCKPCTPVEGCFNDCGECELCIGRDELPESCYPDDGGVPDGGYDGGTPPPRCPDGVQECGLEGDDPCPTDYYCVTGCCQSTII